MKTIELKPGLSFDEIKKQTVEWAYEHFKQNKTKAAESLDITTKTLDSWLGDIKASDNEAKFQEMELHRKISKAMIHYFSDKSKVCKALNIPANELNLLLYKIAQDEAKAEQQQLLKGNANDGIQAEAGLRLESGAEVSEKQSVPVREQDKVQAMLSGKAADRDSNKSSGANQGQRS